MDDTVSTDDFAALRRTVRRCTAVLVVAVGIHLAAVTPGPSNWGLLLATGAGLYLFASVTDLEGDAAEGGSGGATGDGTGGGETDGDEVDGGDEHDEGSAVRSDAGG